MPVRRILPQTERDLEFVDRVDAALLNELVAYWGAKRAGRMVPRRTDIDPAELKARLPHLVMLDVLDAGADFRYRLIGTAVVQGLGRDSTGRRMSDLFANQPAVQKSLSERFRRVVARKGPSSRGAASSGGRTASTGASSAPSCRCPTTARP